MVNPVASQHVPKARESAQRSFGSILGVMLLGHLLAFMAWYDDIGLLAGLFALPAAAVATVQRGTRGALFVSAWAFVWNVILASRLVGPTGTSLGLLGAIFHMRHVALHVALTLAFVTFGRQRDLTRELERQKEELLRTQEALREAERMREEARLGQRLSRTERMASVGALAAGVAHEVNNPLTYVIGNLYYALEELDRTDKEPEALRADLHELLRDALDGAQRVRRIVRDLKTFSRATDDEQEQSIDVNASVATAVNLVNNEIRHRARLSLALSDVPRVYGSEPKLVQAFVNLLMNAAQAIAEGNADGELIEVRSSLDPEGRVRVDFRDTGAGMSHEVKARIFDPFFTTKPASAGSGIGLSVANGIVQSMGGEITVESREGEGSTFTVLLPAERADHPSVHPRRSPMAPRARPRLRVLVVDDEPKVGVSLRRMLRDWDVQVVEDGREALALLRRDPGFDAILCDLMMPHVTGMDLYSEAERIDPALPKRFVFMTGGAFTPRSRAFVAEVPNTTLEKPFDKAQLLTAIEGLLREPRGS